MKFPVLENGWTGGQFSLFRILLGLYLCIHFLDLVPWAPEVFSSAGMLSDGGLSPLIGLFPNIFLLNDSPQFVQGVVISGVAASLLFTAGYRQKMAAVWCLFVLASLFGRNPLIANPALPYVGFMLLASLFVPSGAYGSHAAKGRDDLGRGWVMPQDVILGAWIVLALTYSYSGYTKLLSPSWVSGDNIQFVLNNPLARDYFLRDLFLWLPPIFLKLATWGVLVIELFFLPLVLFKKLRPVMWTLMLLIQIGFALLLNFFDLTAAMLLFHLFTFDPAWIKANPKAQKMTLFYDGECGFCHTIVRFLLAEDKQNIFSFAPLQGSHLKTFFTEAEIASLPDSIVLRMNDGSTYLKSSAVAQMLMAMQGLWRPIGFLLWCIPAVLRDLVYDGVGKIRKRLAPTPQGLCPVLIPEFRARFTE